MYVLSFKDKEDLDIDSNWRVELDGDDEVETWTDLDDATQVAKDRESHNLYGSNWRVEEYEQ